MNIENIPNWDAISHRELYDWFIDATGESWVTETQSMVGEQPEQSERVAVTVDRLRAELPAPVAVTATDHALRPGLVSVFRAIADREDQEDDARQAEYRARELARQYESMIR